MHKDIMLTKLAAALDEATNNEYGTPSVFGPVCGWEEWTLAWDGPYDWTMITAGSSVFAGELGRYSKPLEDGIAKVVKLIEDAGFYLEPANCSHLHVWKA